MPDIDLSAIQSFAFATLVTVGVPDEDAGIVAQSIYHAHSRGKHTHGAVRLPIYVRKIRQKIMPTSTVLTEVTSAPAMAVFSANDGLGQVAAIKGMDRAIQMARECGIGVVGVRRSHNFGTAAFIAERATARGMAGIVMANASAAIAPTGGAKAVFGTNPIALGVPGPAGAPPVVLDMATSQISRGRIRLAATNGESIPYGWALDENGQPTSDPKAALKGSMLALGGAKGYGLSLMIDVFAGLMTGAAFAGRSRALDHPSDPSDSGHLLIALDISKFLAPEIYADRIADLVATTKAAGPVGAVALPGERSGLYMVGRDGLVPISSAVLAKLDMLADEIGISRLPR
jgi:L-2-hydroxycarboxylate dehydrogenase (NAD+)